MDAVPLLLRGEEAGELGPHRYMPRVRDVYGNDPGRMPFDFPQVIAEAIAPRAVFSNSPVGDANFEVAGVRAAEPGVRSGVRARRGWPGRFVVRIPAYGHDFGEVERREAYRFNRPAVRVHAGEGGSVTEQATGIPTLDTQRLELRPFEFGDAAEVRRLAGDFEVGRNRCSAVPAPVWRR